MISDRGEGQAKRITILYHSFFFPLMRLRYLSSCIHRHHQSLHLHPLLRDWKWSLSGRERKERLTETNVFSVSWDRVWKKGWFVGAREFIFLLALCLALDYHCFFRLFQMCQRVYFLSHPLYIHTHNLFTQRYGVEMNDVRIGLVLWFGVVSTNKSKRLRRSSLFLLYLLLYLPHRSKLRFLLVFL